MLLDLWTELSGFLGHLQRGGTWLARVQVSLCAGCLGPCCWSWLGQLGQKCLLRVPRSALTGGCCLSHNRPRTARVLSQEWGQQGWVWESHPASDRLGESGWRASVIEPRFCPTLHMGPTWLLPPHCFSHVGTLFFPGWLNWGKAPAPWRFPRCLSCKEPAGQCRRCRFDPWVRKMPWRRKWQLIPVFLPGNSPRQRGLLGYSP